MSAGGLHACRFNHTVAPVSLWFGISADPLDFSNIFLSTEQRNYISYGWYALIGLNGGKRFRLPNF